MLLPADQLEEARFANTSHSALYLHIPEFCDAGGTKSKLSKHKQEV